MVGKKKFSKFFFCKILRIEGFATKEEFSKKNFFQKFGYGVGGRGVRKNGEKNNNCEKSVGYGQKHRKDTY